MIYRKCAKLVFFDPLKIIFHNIQAFSATARIFSFQLSDMFGLFKKKPKEKQPPQLQDLNGKPIKEGDKVTSLRYELGTCKVVLEGLEYFYVSEENGDKVSYVKMVDAITENQKVLLIEGEGKEGA